MPDPVAAAPRAKPEPEPDLTPPDEPADNLDDPDDEAAMKLLRKMMGLGGDGLPDLDGDGPDDADLAEIDLDDW